ncbi:unnamed protein product [Symbiodinium sp. CCMP2592]|nr:unnamed protein product [Symbiodinium sp. CCMP2592]
MGIDPIATILFLAYTTAASLDPEPIGPYDVKRGSIRPDGHKFDAAGERPRPRTVINYNRDYLYIRCKNAVRNLQEPLHTCIGTSLHISNHQNKNRHLDQRHPDAPHNAPMPWTTTTPSNLRQTITRWTRLTDQTETQTPAPAHIVILATSAQMWSRKDLKQNGTQTQTTIRNYEYIHRKIRANAEPEHLCINPGTTMPASYYMIINPDEPQSYHHKTTPVETGEPDLTTPQNYLHIRPNIQTNSEFEPLHIASRTTLLSLYRILDDSNQASSELMPLHIAFGTTLLSLYSILNDSNPADPTRETVPQQATTPETLPQEHMDAVSLLKLPALAIVSVTAAWDEPFLAHDAPQWFWTTFDKGAEGGACWKAMARMLETAFQQQGDEEEQSDSFWTDTELIRNHYATRWWRHAQRRDQRGDPLPGTPPTEDELQTLINKIADLVFRAWWRERTTLLTGGGRLRPCGCIDMTDAETSSDEASCSSTPTPRMNNDPDVTIDIEDQSETDDDNDIHSLMEHRHKEEEVPAPTTPTAPATSSTDLPDTATNAEMTPEDAVAVWQSIFEWEAQESLDPTLVPLLPTHISDSIVETLADKTEAEHNLMTDVLPQFLARIQTDLAEALLRARDLRNRLNPDDPKKSPAGKKRPAEAYETEEDEENDESMYMQTTHISSSTSSTPPQQPNDVLCALHEALGRLQPARATSRALRLMQRLQEHDGRLLVDREALESLLIAASGDVPPEPEGDALILEMGWVGTWWRRITGTEPLGPQPIDLDLEFMEKHAGDDTIRNAEEADQAAREEAYQRWADEAGAKHMEETEAAKAKTEDEDTLKEAMGLSWEPPTKRLCIGICIDDGRRAKAWEWELDKGATIQVHIKAEKKEFSGRWLRGGRPIRDDEVPKSFQKNPDKKAPATAKPLATVDLTKPATRELYSRWSQPKVSDQAVVQIGGIAMLMAFKEELFPHECQQDLDMRDTYNVSKYDDNHDDTKDQSTPGLPSGHNEPASLPAPHRGPARGNGLPEEAAETVLSEETTVAVHQEDAHLPPDPTDTTHGDQREPEDDVEATSNPDPYYNGRVFFERYGRDGDEQSERGSGSS